MKKRTLIIITLVILVLGMLSGHDRGLPYDLRRPKGPVVWFVNLMMQKNEEANAEVEEDTTINKTEETTNQKDSAVVAMSDGFQLETTLPEQIGVSDEDAALGDSYVQVGDTNGVEEYFAGIGINQDNIYSCTADNKDIYLGEEMTDKGIHHIYILQDVGAKNYLKVEVLDEKNTLTIENIMAIITLSAS